MKNLALGIESKIVDFGYGLYSFWSKPPITGSDVIVVLLAMALASAWSKA